MKRKNTVIPSNLLPFISCILSLGLAVLSLLPAGAGSAATIVICSLAVFILIPTCTVIMRYCFYIPDLKKSGLKNPNVRANLSLAVGTAFNISYSVYKLSSGIKYSSVWFISVAVYYTLQSLIKAVLLAGRSDGDYAHICKSCGIAMLFSNISVGIVTFSMLFGDRLYFYNGMSLPVTAAYTLLRITAAVFASVRARNRLSEIYRAAKYINLSTALLSVYSLETALLDKYGIIAPNSRRPFGFFTGTAITTALVFLSVKVIKIKDRNGKAI